MSLESQTRSRLATCSEYVGTSLTRVFLAVGRAARLDLGDLYASRPRFELDRVGRLSRIVKGHPRRDQNVGG